MKKIVLLAIIIVCVCKSIGSKAQANFADSIALVDLYNNTNGVNWTHQNNWLTSKPISQWYGITVVVDTATERVSSINLSNNNLKGAFSPSIANLNVLASINLSDNSMTGKVPDQLITLRNLGTINITGNQFTDTIPSDILNYYFDHLYFATNKFTFQSIEPILAKGTVVIDTAFYYSPQANIPIHYNAGNLSVSAGGTVLKNTYKWYRNDTLLASNAGDSIFLVSLHGKYYVKVSNSTATRLTLQSDTFNLTKDTIVNGNAPLVSSFSPVIAGGGTAIIIKGHNFLNCFSVTFGGVSAASFNVISDSVINAVVGTQGSSGIVSITTPFGTGSASGFTFIFPPKMTSFNPSYGKAGDTISISGKYFSNISTITFGNISAASFKILNDSLIKAVLSSNGASGFVKVKDLGGADSLSLFTFLDSIPIISNFTPTAAGGGTTVTIKGRHFSYSSQVSFGNIQSSSFSVVSDSIINAVVNSQGASGSVEVTNPVGVGLATGFTFISPPKIKSFNPTSGKTGDTILILGNYFSGTTIVNFGNTPAASFKVVNDSLIKASLSSNGSSGYIGITTLGGTDSLAQFTFYPEPVITSFTPQNGSESVTISIYGSYLSTVSSVKFGNVSAESFTVVSDQLITAVVGKGSSGNITVTTRGGTATIGGFVGTPVITTFYPTSGPINTLVTIKGHNFSDTAQNNILFIGNIKATIVAANDTVLVAHVPAGATISPIVETVNYLSAATMYPFVVTFPGGDFTDSTFASRVNYPAIYASSLQIADIDNDGKQDLSVTLASPHECLIYGNTSSVNSISLNQPISLSTVYGISKVFPIDVNSDGKIDLGAATGGDLYGTTVYQNQSSPGNISFGNELVFKDNALEGAYIVSGDLDGDGKPDIIIGGNYGSFYILQNTSSRGVISYNTIGQIASSSGNTSCMLLKDLDGDGKLDLLVGDKGAFNISASVAIYRNVSTNGSFGFLYQKKLYTTGAAVADVACGDLNADGKPDIVFTDGTSHYIYQNHSTPGNFSFGSGQIITGGTNGIGIGDMNGDGKLDLAIANYASNNVSIYKNTSTIDSISFATNTDYPTGVNPQNVTVADMDNDGKPEILVINNGDSTFSILHNNIHVQKLDSLIVPAHPQTEYANREFTGTDGWTNYYFDNNTPNDYTDDTLLLSLNKKGQNIGALGDGTFSVKLAATGLAGSNTSIELTNPLITNPTGFWVMNRYWLVTPTTEPTTDVGVRFYYNNQDLADVNGSYLNHNLTNQQLIFYKTIGGNPDPTTNLAGAIGIISIMNASYASDTTWSYHQLTDTTQYAEFSVAGFSGGGGGGTGNDQALPIKLLSFNVSKQNNNALLQWTTTQEVNAGYYEVERSIDGVHFTDLNKVTAKGSVTANNYSYTDNTLSSLINHPSTVFYRLKMFDKNRSYALSATKQINFTPIFATTIYPNPTKDNLNISITATKDEAAQIQIINAQGKALYNQKINLSQGSSTQTINVSKLAKGNYFVEIKTDEGSRSEKFVKE